VSANVCVYMYIHINIDIVLYCIFHTEYLIDESSLFPDQIRLKKALF
jgi:hypothetical protein